MIARSRQCILMLAVAALFYLLPFSYAEDETCIIAGDVPPCNIITISEVVDCVNRYSAGELPLEDVINIMNYWQSNGDMVFIKRFLPVNASSDSNFTVRLFMFVTGNPPPAVGLTERFPVGWVVYNVTRGGITQVDRIEWLFWSLGQYHVETQNITYDIFVPEDFNGTAYFSGDFISYTTFYVSGNRTIVVSGEGTTTPTAPEFWSLSMIAVIVMTVPAFSYLLASRRAI